jgi:dUTP pyrophosphatase
MKLKIKVKRINKNLELPKIIDKGDWVDLRASETVTLNYPKAETLKRKTVDGVEYKDRKVIFEYSLIPLGVAMELPKGYEAAVIARSSTPSKFGVMTANSMGLIDNCYNGDTDEWKYPCIAWKEAKIEEGDRICQFRIQLSQKATVWQKIKWLFTSGIEIVEVDSLNNEDRSGFHSTGTR